jgi:multiple sugar transport system permease protein
MRNLVFGLALAAFGIAQAADPVELRFMLGAGIETIGVMNPLIAEFERENPGVKVRLERITEERDRKLLIQYAARTAPDVFATSILGYRMFAYRDVFIPVEELAGKFGMTYSLERVYPNVREFVRYNGKTWALPSSVNSPMIVFYNRKHFREAGIPEPDGTWSYDLRPRPELREKDFVWVMQQLSRPGTAKERRWGFTTAWPQLFANSLLATRGLKLWDNDDNPTMLAITQPDMVDLMQFAADCVQKHRWIPAFGEINQGMGSSMYDEFVRGRISMYQSGAWDIIRLRRDAPKNNLDWEITTFPRFAGKPYMARAEGNAIAVVRTTKHPELAWKLAQFLAGEKVQIALARAGENQPAFKDLSTKPGVWLPAPGDRAREVPRNLIVTHQLAESMVAEMTPEYFDPVRNGLEGSFFGILSEGQPAKEALKRVERESNVRLSAALRRTEKAAYPWGAAIALAAAALAGLIYWVYKPSRGEERTARDKRSFRIAHLFLIPWFLGMALTLGPMAYSLMLSFSDSDVIREPNWVGLQNYTDAFSGMDPVFYISLQVTAYYALLSIPAGLIASLLLALLLNVKVEGIPLFRALYYIPSLASAVAMSLVWMRIFHPENGIVNRLLYGEGGKGPVGLWISDVLGVSGQQVNWFMNEKTVMPAFIIMGLWGAGGGTIILLAGLQNIAQQYYEASKIDGAGPIRQFFSITLPLLSPTLFFSLITGVIGSFQVFTQAFIITSGGPNNATVFYMLNLYSMAFRDLRMGYASALAWILFVIILVFTAIQLKAAKKWVFYEGDEK